MLDGAVNKDLSKLEKQAELYKLEKECDKALNELYNESNNSLYNKKVIVFGEGNPDADIVLAGEAPGEQETKQKRPFAGQAGKHLDRFLEVIQLKRQDIYITNVVKFRPYKINEKTGRVINRPPDSSEIAACGGWLIKMLDIIQPAVVVTLGNVPLKFFLGEEKSIGGCHGMGVPVHNMNDMASFEVFPLYHPASVIYNRSLEEVYRKDLMKLREFLIDKKII